MQLVIDFVGVARLALTRWPWIPDVESAHQLPRAMLLAVGLRETGLRDIVGDSGHGHGPWQLDDRTAGRAPMIARIDAGDTEYAAEVAAKKLQDDHARFGDWLATLNVYNSGQPLTRHTTHGDYGPSVLGALAVLQGAIPAAWPRPTIPALMEVDVQVANVAKTAFLPAASAGVTGADPKAGYELHADGGVDAILGAPFFGGWFNLSEAARANQPVGPFLAITPLRDGGAGYEIHRADGAYYSFGPGLNGFAKVPG